MLHTVNLKLKRHRHLGVIKCRTCSVSFFWFVSGQKNCWYCWWTNCTRQARWRSSQHYYAFLSLYQI